MVLHAAFRARGRRRAALLLAVLAGASVAMTGCATPRSGPTPPSAVRYVSAVRVDSALHALLPSAIRSGGVVRVATDVPYPPFEMFAAGSTSTLTGLDYDLGQALGRKLGVRFAFAEQKFDGIVPSIQARKFDVAISAMTDTKERERVLDFVDYSASGSGILVTRDNPHHIRTLLDLCGKKVGVQSGSKQAALLTSAKNPCTRAGRPTMQVARYPKDTDAQLAVISGTVIADVLDKPAAGYAAATAEGGKRFKVVDDPNAPTGTDATPNGIGVSKRLPGLRTAIQRALQALMTDGTYRRILAVYGQSGIAIRRATVNGAVN